MKRVFVCLMAVAVIAVASAAVAQGPDAETQGIMQKVRLLQLADDIGLDDAATMRMALTFTGYQSDLCDLMAQRAELCKQLAAAGPGDDVSTVLNGLMEADDKILTIQLDAFEDMASGLNSYQEARLYVFLLDLTRQDGRGVRRPMAMAAPAEAAAPAEETAEATGDEAQIAATIKALKEGLEALDIDRIVDTFSDDFYHPEVGGKEEGRYMMEMGIDMGYADDGEVYIDNMEIEIDGDEAVVYPIELSAPAGAATVEAVLQKEDGGWKITTLNVDGL